MNLIISKSVYLTLKTQIRLQTWTKRFVVYMCVHVVYNIMY